MEGLMKMSWGVCLCLLAMITPGGASERNKFRMEVLLDGRPAPEYWHQGTTYVEALKGKEYSLRLTNPLPVRVAVALAVDGLNTIDARHTDAWAGRKWVLGPYETIVLEGWQTNAREARRFFFTTEERSYGAWLGKTENLGVISAVFFREKELVKECNEEKLAARDARERSAPAAPAAESAAGASAKARQESQHYAATGIGDRIGHAVEGVYLDLEKQPCASFSLRYEYRLVLARLGVLPYPRPRPDPLERRRQAQGFDDMSFCPVPH